ncbi:hypothetical protein [Azospira restricta]|uniref:Uncharacterized protein n=1 Tax=Azospira restricta TaxID=404405 RepID=A0A974PWX9_9RHOO|nr:hypothetical protein [Azospira restricta]QRJ62643.1 hypothetical protein IWH25_12775 [Azospira restricta]
MPEQAVDRRRCASCERWSGARSAGGDGASVLIASETATGTCVGGPWDGSERRARSACGQWLRWQALPPPAPERTE